MLNQNFEIYTQNTQDFEANSSVHPAQERMWSNHLLCKKYENFARHKPYISSIEKLIGLLGEISSKHILELGCGVGSATERLLKAGSVIATDISPITVSHCENKLQEFRNVRFIKEEAIKAIVDYGFYSDIIIAVNCIHLFQNLNIVLEAAYQFLPHKGQLAFSTTLTRDATDRDEGFAFIQAISELRSELSASNIKRQKEKSHPKLRMSSDYPTLCENAGFYVSQMEVQKITQSLDMIRDFLLLPGVLEDLLSINIEETQRLNLANNIIENLKKYGYENGINRNWLHVVAEKY